MTEYVRIDPDEAHVLIMDANNLAYRARHSFALSHKGKDVSVLYGVLKSVIAALGRYCSSTIVMCWDYGIPAFRYQMMPTYKKRDYSDDPTRQGFLDQMNELHEILPKFGILSVRKGGAEADDLIACVSRMFRGVKLIISTDKDMFQCISDSVSVFNPYQEKYIRQDNFKRRTGVPFTAYPLYRSIIGDSSDGIPGVKGVGPAACDKIINDLGIHSTSDLFYKLGEGVLIGAMAKKLKDAGKDYLDKSIDAMDLSVDRVGATDAILDAIEIWEQFDRSSVVDYLNSNMFVSLKNVEVFGRFRRLVDPIDLLKERYLIS